MSQANVPLGAPTILGFSRARWSVMSAGVGAVVWLAMCLVPVSSAPSFGSIEHLFLFMPLVAAPLALLLVRTLLEPDGRSTRVFHDIAEYVQPVAAIMVLVSFFVPKGALPGGLTLAWLLMTLALAVGGVRQLGNARPAAYFSNASLFFAFLFLPVGAVWLLLSRLGLGPRNFAPLTVFLAALHFHFSGFTLQLLIAATGRALEARRSRIGPLHRCLAVGTIAGIPLIAAGNILSAALPKYLGVASIVLSTIALAITSTAVALTLRSSIPRRLLLVSAASIAAGMVLAGIYGVGELTGAGWIGIPRMVTTHGLLNALGFILCGLAGHLHLRRAE